MSGAVSVDPSEYTAASVSFGAGIAGGVDLLYNELLRALADTEAMAGHDGSGRAWGQRYDTLAPQVFKTIWSLQVANVKLGMMLEHTGFNHSLAESSSNSGRRSPMIDSTDYAANAPFETCPDIPKATGGSGDYPTGWSLVRGTIGFEWPDGQQDKLRSAAAAWDAAGNSLSGLVRYVGDGVISIALQGSPEVADAMTVCSAMQSHLETAAGMCHAMANSCRQLAASIDIAHHKAIHALKVLVTLSAATQVTGGVFAIVSLGISEAVAQTAEAAEISVTATEVSAYLATFCTEAGEAALMVSSVDSEVLAVGQLLQPLIDADLVTADAALVAQLDTTGVLLPELQAEGRLAASAASGQSGKLLWTSWRNYPKVVRSGRTYAQVGDRLYTHHAVDRLQPSGLGAPAGIIGAGRSVSPTDVDFILSNAEGTQTTGPLGEVRVSYRSGNVQVITEDGIVVSVITR